MIGAGVEVLVGTGVAVSVTVGSFVTVDVSVKVEVAEGTTVVAIGKEAGTSITGLQAANTQNTKMTVTLSVDCIFILHLVF